MQELTGADWRVLEGGIHGGLVTAVRLRDLDWEENRAEGGERTWTKADDYTVAAHVIGTGSAWPEAAACGTSPTSTVLPDSSKVEMAKTDADLATRCKTLCQAAVIVPGTATIDAVLWRSPTRAVSSVRTTWLSPGVSGAVTRDTAGEIPSPGTGWSLAGTVRRGIVPG